MDQASALFDESRRKALCREIPPRDRTKLVHWQIVEERTKANIIAVLEATHPPKPRTWPQLFRLWAYIAEDVAPFSFLSGHEGVHIIPVRGEDILHTAAEVVRLGERRLLQSEADWQFLAQHLVVMNQHWVRFLAERRRSEEHPTDEEAARVEACYRVLSALGLAETSDVNKVIDRIATKFFAQKELRRSGCVRLAQIAARLGAAVGGAFRFVTRDNYLRSIGDHIVFDGDRSAEPLLEPTWAEAHVLPDDYGVFESCSAEEWRRWIRSGRSGLCTFIPFSGARERVWGRTRLREILRKKGFRGDPYYPYVTQNFIIEDWDFPAQQWGHWEALAKEDPRLWVRVFTAILEQPQEPWTKALSARVLQSE